MRLLLMEDDDMIAEIVAGSMQRIGFAVDWVQDGQAAQLSLRSYAYDLLLLDLGLPKKGGIDALRSYRSEGGTAAVIVLTARDDIDKLIVGLRVDDYLIKPFDLTELEERAHALMRRRSGETLSVFSNGGLTFNPGTNEVKLCEQALLLAPGELAVLSALIEMPMRVFKKAELEEKLHGWGERVDSDTVDSCVDGLRRKIGIEQIMTVRGVGYRLKHAG